MVVYRASPILIIIPKPIQVVTISLTETFIILASSLAVANSAILIVCVAATFCDVSSAAISFLQILNQLEKNSNAGIALGILEQRYGLYLTNENVYNSHLNGKKHIQALERGGQKAEAERIRKKLQEAKIAAEAKKAQELAEAATDAAKRKAEEAALVRTFAQSSAQVPLYGGCGLIRGFITARG